jgi:hypothetical protein
VNNDAIYVSNLPFAYEVSAKVLSLQPAYGVEYGGTTVLVHGEHFVQTVSGYCKFGGLVVAARWLSSSLLQCVSPTPLSTTAVAVEVTMNDQDYTSDGVLFTYQPNAHVHTITPSKGAYEGGTYVILKGSGFQDVLPGIASMLHCKFNMTQVQATWYSSHEVHCIAPQHAAGYVTVEVTLNNQDYTTDGVEYQYQVVNFFHVSPLHGPIAGGTMVRISGENIYPPDVKGLKCVFGDAPPVDAVYESTTLIREISEESPGSTRQ